MKFEYVKKIVEKIQQDISCPKCKKKCSQTPLELCNIDNNTIGLQMVCPHCEAHMRIAAEVHVSEKNGSPSRRRPISHFLSVENMSRIKTSLKDFKGDVRALF